MELGRGTADLHLHTTASDGTCSIKDRATQARKRKLQTIAVTDHDSISTELNGRSTRESGVEIVTGVEVRGDVCDCKVEILGYFVDPDDDGLNSVLEQARSFRRKRNREMVHTLNDKLSLALEYETLVASTDGMLGRPHLAGKLEEKGIVDSIGEAFELYLGTDGIAYVPMDRVPAGEIIAAVQGAGGVASLAHPGRIRSDNVSKLLASLVADGLDAIEVQYPYEAAPTDGYADVTVTDAAAFAEKHDLLSTGGSDCHGPGSGKFMIGDVRISGSEMEEIRSAATTRQEL